MKPSRRNLIAGATAPLAGALLGWAVPRGPGPALAPRERIQRHHFPDCELTTHEGKTVRFYSDLVRDKKVVFQFMYTRCKGVCLPVTDNLVRVQKLLEPRVGRDIFFYSISLEPALDTPEDLRRYAVDHDVGPGWLLLTGPPADCELLRRSLGFTDPDPTLDADVTNHSGNLLFGNEPLMLWAACPGEADPQWIADEILGQVDRG